MGVSALSGSGSGANCPSEVRTYVCMHVHVRTQCTLLQDFDDAAALLSSSNISQKCLQDYAREVAVYATKGGLGQDTLEFKLDARGREDVALFDFTSLFAAENAARIVERRGKRVLMCIVGDSLIEVGERLSGLAFVLVGKGWCCMRLGVMMKEQVCGCG